MKEKRNAWWPMALMLVVFAVSRVVPLLSERLAERLANFSAAYALVFCVGAFFGGRVAWGWTFGTMLVTDIGLDFYYHFAKGWEVLNGPALANKAIVYAGFLLLWWLGRRCRRAAAAGREGKLASVAKSWLALLGGGVLGATLFYLITNTASWLINPFANPEYTKDLAGWLAALITGTKGHPPTWEFFRNTLFSGGLFTGLFAATALWSARLESAQEKESANAPAKAEESEPEPEPTHEGTAARRA